MDIEVRFLPSERRVRAARGSTLMAAARRVGLPIASACGADGLCGRCGLEIISGADSLSAASADEADIKLKNRIPLGQRLACRTKLWGDVEVSASYW